jgi:hypothetical protein
MTHIATPSFWLPLEAKQIGYRLPAAFASMTVAEQDRAARRYQTGCLAPYAEASELIGRLTIAPAFPSDAGWEVGISNSLMTPAQKAKWQANMDWRGAVNIVEPVQDFVRGYGWQGNTAQFLAADVLTALLYADRYLSYTLCRQLTLREDGDFPMSQWMEGRNKVWATSAWKERVREMKAAHREAMAAAFA